jgi:hypothetical protein
MPIRIIQDGKYDRPVIFCDHCGDEIKDAEDGNYHWRVGESAGASRAPLFFSHKRCCSAFESTNRGDWGAMELDTLFASLANNLKFDLTKARKRAALLDLDI